MYSYTIQGIYKIPAEVAGKELERIREKYGTLEAEKVVEESKDDSSVLHSIFEWDEKKAADSWRVNQAKALIRSIVVNVEREEIKCKVRAFVSVSNAPGEKATYVPINDASNNEYAKWYLMNCAKHDMECFTSKYRTLSELGEIISQMKLFLD